MAERILIAACVGTCMAVVVWVISTGMHTPHVWPGTIFAFAVGTASTLITLRGRR